VEVSFVQAIKTLGREWITSEVISQIRIRTKPSMLKAILKDAQPVSQWILDAIKEICAEKSE
jgi:prophage antirepressor-like protein